MSGPDREPEIDHLIRDVESLQCTYKHPDQEFAKSADRMADAFRDLFNDVEQGQTLLIDLVDRFIAAEARIVEAEVRIKALEDRAVTA